MPDAKKSTDEAMPPIHEAAMDQAPEQPPLDDADERDVFVATGEPRTNP